MSALAGLMKTVSDLPDPAKKRIASLLGAVVADAASLPLQWIYKDATMKDIVGDKNPEFWPECHCPFFTVPTGKNSCYGDEMRTCLSSLAANAGGAGPQQIAAELVNFYGPADSPYQVALAKRADKKYPVEGPWINSGVIQFLKNSGSGIVPPGSADCEDNDGFAVSLPVHLKDPAQTEDVASLLTTNPMVQRHLRMQTAILDLYLAGAEDPVGAAAAALAAELPDVAEEIQAVQQAVNDGKALGEIIEEFGKACGLPGSFQGSVAALLTNTEYVSAVRSNILGGGDCCSRSAFLGACLAAKGGVQAIPMEWIERVDGIQQVLEAAVHVYQ